MAIYRNIQMTFWTDAKVSEDFTPEDRYFYLYLMTNPHSNLCGCFDISVKQMGYETGYSKETIEKLIRRMAEVHKVAFYDEQTKEMLVVNWHKYNWTNSEKFRKPLLKEINAIKSDRFREYLTEVFQKKDTVSIPYPYGSDTTVTVTDTINNNIKDINDIDTFTESRFSKQLQQSINKWMEYKEERGQGYHKTALDQFLNMIEKKLKTVQEDQIIDLVDRCMANNYQGLVWELIEKPRGKPSTWSNLESEKRKNERDDFYDELQKHIVGG